MLLGAFRPPEVIKIPMALWHPVVNLQITLDKMAKDSRRLQSAAA
jgi:hypothetical protein